MSEMDVLFPLPDGRRNADDMGMPAPVCRECERLRADLAAARALLRLIEGGVRPPTDDELVRELGAQIVDLRAERYALAALLRDIKNDPHGCRFCDDGVLRAPNNPDKDHDPGCVWPRIDAALAKP